MPGLRRHHCLVGRPLPPHRRHLLQQLPHRHTHRLIPRLRTDTETPELYCLRTSRLSRRRPRIPRLPALGTRNVNASRRGNVYWEIHRDLQSHRRARGAEPRGWYHRCTSHLAIALPRTPPPQTARQTRLGTLARGIQLRRTVHRELRCYRLPPVSRSRCRCCLRPRLRRIIALPRHRRS